MTLSFQSVDLGFSVKMTEDRTALRWLRLFASCVSLVFVVTCGFLLTKSLVASVVMAAIPVYWIYAGLRNLFSVAELVIQDQTLVFNQLLGPFRRSLPIPRADVEWLAHAPEFNGYKNHQDSGLMLMLRSRMQPILFARTITPAEAAQVLAELKERGFWLAPLVRPVGTPPF